MASSAAQRRLKKEYTALEKEPAPGAIVRPLETNFLHAHFLLMGPVFYDTPYEGGVYHGVLKFPTNYPMKPPSVIMRTPSGRFDPDKKICFSLSDFHPELWNPMWSIRTILTGLVSFMNSEEITTGGLSAPVSSRTELAKKSLLYCLERDALAKELFGLKLECIHQERSSLGTSWPPTRPTVVETAKTPKAPPTKATQKLSKETEANTKAKEAITPDKVGKNAAKNKKKREREKRRKLAKTFFTTLSEQVPKFLRSIEDRLKEQSSIDVSQYCADHVCWRTETIEEYSDLVGGLRSASDDCTLLIESEIGGRSIATFSLTKGILAGSRMVEVVEIPAPKDGSPYRTGLEHVEFVIGEDEPPSSPMNDDVHRSVLDQFTQQYPQVEWITKAKNKEINPDVSMKVDSDDFGVSSVKFHLVPLAKVIEYEKRSNLA